MRVGEICTREVVTCAPSLTVVEAAKLMRRMHVGALIVTRDRAGQPPEPAGILTDRDIVLEVVALDLLPEECTVADLTGAGCITIRESEDVAGALDRMASHGIERLPVVDDLGGLVGLVTRDDLLSFTTVELGRLAGISGRQREHEVQARAD